MLNHETIIIGLAGVYGLAILIWAFYISNGKQLDKWEKREGRMLETIKDKGSRLQKQREFGGMLVVILMVITLIAGLLLFGERVDLPAETTTSTLQ